MMSKDIRSGITITIIICATITALVGIGAWAYTQQQAIAQKDRELQQAKQLKEYEQQQLNTRNKADNQQKCEAAADATPSLLDGIFCKDQ